MDSYKLENIVMCCNTSYTASESQWEGQMDKEEEHKNDNVGAVK